MQLDKIITLASPEVRLRFLALERSLRATGCRLPLWVIPYSSETFALPAGSQWWAMPELLDWLAASRATGGMRKYQCFAASGYQFVDADVVFLRNPEAVLAPHSGFITSCGHWRNPGHTITPDSLKLFAARSTNWQRNVFNSGQFACDRALYTPAGLTRTATLPAYRNTCLNAIYQDQPGLNLLVWHSGVPVSNLTLPPTQMESTWAGDYPGDFEATWSDPERKPYLIHWAGVPMDEPRPINELFLGWLTSAERTEWDEQVRRWRERLLSERRSLPSLARRMKRAFQQRAAV